MFRNYFKIGLRNLTRQKSFSTINIVGLAIGLASSIMILIWIKYELSYDQFHPDKDRTYRLTCQVENINAAISPAPIAAAIQQKIAGVSESLRTSMISTDLLEINNQKYEEKSILYVDSNFFDFFSFRLSVGKEKDALKQPQSIVISEEIAQKYFGRENPLGETIKINNTDDLIVTGVLAKKTVPSHLHFDFLIPTIYLAKTDRDLRENIWDNFNYYSYIKLSNALSSEKEIKNFNQRIDRLYSDNEPILKINFNLQPLSSIHLHSNFLGDVAGHGNIQYVYIFFSTAIFILLIACINFMNLSTARSTRRAREVGFRKVAGASRGQLISQFLIESILISILSLVIAILIVILALPSFNLISGQNIGFEIFDLTLLTGILGLTIIIGLIAGSYPAFYLSGFQPVKVLSMQRSPGRGHQIFRSALVVVQFVFSIVLIIGTVVVHQQQRFIRNQNLGFDKENLLYVALRGKLGQNQDALRSALERNTNTEKYTFVGELPANLLGATINITWDGKNPEEQVLFAQMDVDDQFVDLFNMKMIAGRKFSKDFKTEGKSYIVNEKALEIMGFTANQAIGKSFTLWDGPGTIVGVVNDFHFKPIQQPIDPIVLRYNERGNYVMIRTRGDKTEETISALEHINRDLNPDYPFEYGFLDQDLDQLYQSEKRLGQLVNIFAVLAIFISCLGLYGLSAYLAERRKKEIGVRKVVGASIFHVVYLLTRDFTKPVWLAIIIAMPLTFIIVSKWLENFAYHVNLQWWVFILSCLVAWIIALLTVSFETIKAAIAPPSEALQSE